MLKTPEDRSFLAELTDGVLRLSFNRPEFGNAIPSQNVPLLTDLFRSAQDNPAVRSILIRGEGKVFSAGGDVAAFGRSVEQPKDERAADFDRRLRIAADLAKAIHAFEGGIVTAVRGAAAGAGLFYPLVADVAIGDPSACFVFAHQRVGLTPDGGLTTVLPQVVGVRMARNLLMTSAKVDAEEALRLGMLTEIVAAEELDERAMKAAQRLARAPQLALKMAKHLINATPGATLDAMLEAETAGIVGCVADDDFEEGVRAFLEKRAARFPSAA
ncbi:enoyl-CoA hydratase/isomerase family protein [Croceicoccus mobilis]|uniref:Enoyl-CoA hydratase n=1 Tax=Croceicoccus mobilis TaxID=1703339 RepID=A0A916Z7J2_9SPHN|nr:enoyl-CoA hydratase-related protein [Croceicoccus mobilis]GGD80276.1 enoyl-CoA hydratase [Croceicoccus mobilis]